MALQKTQVYSCYILLFCALPVSADNRFLDEFFQSIEQQIYDTLPAVVNNPYKNTVATIRQGANIPPGEIAYLQQRKPKIKLAIEQALAKPVAASLPTIALCCSGGGYRAMLYTTGALKALAELNLLDTLSYAVGLSGSTWALATWISSGASVVQFHEWLINNISLDMHSVDDEDLALIERTILTKYYLGKSVGFADIYGACIANNLFDFFTKDKDQVFLSNQAAIIAKGKFPMPIYTSINALTQETEKLWYEFTPFEVGAPWLNAYTPAWAFGRKFKNGVSLFNDPEETLATLLGTFGLAVGISLNDAFQLMGICDEMKSSLMKKIISDILIDNGNDRFISAYFWNFALGISQLVMKNATMEMVDAGLNCNIPYAPISGQTGGRAADIIIIVDASAGKVGAELRKAELYAQINKLPFPIIDYSTIDQRAVSVFGVAKTGVPIVIYIPRIVDQNLLQEHINDLPELYNYLHDFDMEACIAHGPCNTFNFIYSEHDARQVTALGEFNMRMAQNILVQAISDFVN